MADADLVVGLRRMSMAHTKARQAASACGARYLSLPEYSLELLANPALLVDFRARLPLTRAIADAFTAGGTVRVMTARGTNMVLGIAGRIGNCCPGLVEEPGSLGSPPDIEANVSPVETLSEGIAVIDGSIPCPEVGLLTESVTLHVSSGRITRFESIDPRLVERLEALFAAVGDDKAYVLAECGIGLNDRAELNGTMLIDEGTFGCVHFGFGSNATVGGVNDVPFHLDFVMRNASLSIDGRPILENGKFCP
jgi:leucyl aminopeptidase (aminopeptidase T)